MQPHMSSASTPSAAASPAPQRTAPQPAIVRPSPRKPGHGKTWLSLALVAAAAVLFFYWKTRSDAQSSQQQAALVTRTGPVTWGDVRHVVRVSGTIQAERFASILAPQIRGSRSDRYRMFNNSASSATPVTASTTAAASAGSATANPAPTTTSSLGATRGTTNRFSDMSGSTAKSGTDFSRATSSTGVTASQTLGSTGSALISPSGGGGGGGGGGGMGGPSSDFMTVLVKCVPAGSHVKAGEVVGEFDRQYQLNRLDDYKASVVQHENNVKKQRADLAVSKQAHDQMVRSAKADWDKAQLDLQTIPVRSAIESEDFQISEKEMAAHYKQVLEENRDFDVSQKAQLRGSELDRDQSKMEEQRAQANVDRMIMKAPIDGIVVMQTIWRGGEFGQVQQGDMIYAGQGFMTIVDPRSMVLNATINQVDSETLRVGMKATVHLDAYSDVALPATVVAVGAMTNAGGWRANWVREVPIRLRLDQSDARIIPDLSGSADIELSAEKDVAVTPLESIFRDVPDGRPYVFVAGPSGFEKREVELGLASNIAVAIRSGVRKGDVVALARPYLETGPRP